ncbi:hypothetical protein FB451DRAFT_1444746, partial [Mycena latifolia]
GPVNTAGLLSLPVETFHLITSYFVGAPIPCTISKVLPGMHLERPEALRALSHTCRRLRSVFLAQAWERLEVCASRSVVESRERSALYEINRSKKLAKDLARELVRQTEILSPQPPLLIYRSIVSVVLAGWSADTVFPAFFHCLSLLPHLETIQVLLFPSIFSKTMTGNTFSRLIPSPLDPALRGRIFPAVRTLILHPNAFEIVRCCPNTERLSVLGRISELSWVQRHSIKDHAPNLRALIFLPVPSACVKEFAECMPLLHEIPPLLVQDLTPDILQLLAPMPNLRRIALVANDEQAPDLSRATEALVRAAQAVLRGCSSDMQGTDKCVSVEFAGGCVRTYPVISLEL